MRAIEFHGDERLELVERPDPAPAPGQLLIAPSAVGICGTDVEIFEGSLAYFRMGIAEYPIVPGHEWTGVVVDVGEGVTGFSPGDQIVGEVAIGCGVCVRCRAGRSHLCARRTETGIVHMDGAMASRMVFPAAYAHVVPFSSRQAALVEPTSVALHGVTRGQVAGKHVVVIGIGPIGLLAAQIARAHGAASVTVSDTREDRLLLGAGLGFPRFEGREAEWDDPVAAAAAAAATFDGPDVALLCAGGPGAIRAAFAAVRPGGTVVALGLSGAPEIPFDWDGLVVRDIDLIGVLGSVGYWQGAIDLIGSGAVLTEPLVTRAFALEDTRDALERLVDPGSLKVLIEPGD
ncbi:alcohol dehydrogenase catalytic domain-containing protein [Solirubrobacter phytolaccae]|uniref:Alcohol dehydrogenase catalytic domain-containing protein n=1 Tax=Solirubrobacter phytolaccae TaxID=1404360 RepID=A0A9X3SI82_9ACTN|nr:alcohol dehydrogenase catalytic domain-containing protein [Solirubrobacter phytolaccae]MDA0184007.1 alcohol dehydrogenase catalytic domain-containing protein [Solirubrobacter phytolaccae]